MRNGPIERDRLGDHMIELSLELRLWTPGWASMAAAILQLERDAERSEEWVQRWPGVERRHHERRTGSDRRTTPRTALDRRGTHDRRRSPAAFI